ncbi:MAG: hypothetical protein RLZZ227_1422 [Pseudomonadota bacterium]|jgi:hypothetical protein
MTQSAGSMLQVALEHAVQQLEPQLLPLFSTSRTARERPVLPTVRTQLALKTLVALTRFFPAEHRVHRAGQQLELIWTPLVHEPRGAAASSLLQYYFRARQDLLDTPDSALRQSLRDIVRSGIEDAALTHDEARMLHCERRLQALATFIDDELVSPAALAALSPLARLLRWQHGLESPMANAGELARTVRPQLMPALLAVLERCAMLCSASDWTLKYFCGSGLAQCLRQLRGLAQFCGNTTGAELIGWLDDRCLDMHLTGRVPAPGAMQEWLARLFAVVHQDEVHHETCARAESLHNVAPATALHLAETQDEALLEADLQSAYEAELELYRQDLQQQLQGDRPKVTARLLALLYKLTWIFAAAGHSDWSRLYHCAYYVALQFWRTRRPLSAECHAALTALSQDCGAAVSASDLRCWRQQLLQDWPCWTDDSKRLIALPADAGDAVALDAVPALLSGSFVALVRAGAASEAPATDTCAPLLAELALLEKGAAAMKIWPLEQLCSVLMATYEARLRDAASPPAQLMQQAHRQLVRMLDDAAAWQQVQPADVVVQQLEAWLASRSSCREPLPGVEPGGDGAPPLRDHLLGFLGTLACVLERPVRLQLDADSIQLDPPRIRQVLECLRPLIKFMLLDQAVDARGRHAMHKPRVSTLVVSLRSTSARLVITAAEDSHELVLAPADLQRLQRRLPKSAGLLTCKSRAGLGRSFTFTLD